MLERLTVPRRPFDFEDYVDVLRRNVRWLIGPAFIGLVAATVVAYMMTDTYVSSAMIRIVPQQVPEALVQTVVNQQLADRINSMAETIESRNSLQNIITTYGLYQKRRDPLEDVISDMRKAIQILPTDGVTNANGRAIPAFRLTFSYENRYTAQKVCQELVSRFVSENASGRSQSAIATTQFLSDEFAKAKQDLDAIENKLTEFRVRNAGHLPEEIQMNMSQMNALDNRLTSLNDAAGRAAQEKMLIESQLQYTKDRLAAIHETPGEVVAALHDEHLDTLDRQIAQGTTNLASLRERYKETYPDVISARDQLAQWKKQREALLQDLKSRKPETHASPNASLAERERQELSGRVQQLQAQLQAKDLETKQLQQDIARVNSSIQQYQSRIESVPVGEKEYNDLIRDRDLAKSRYQDLEVKRTKSSIAMEMENRKQGETLEVLDQASLPDKPTAPKRAIIIPMGLLAGLVVGLVLVAVREVKDTSLKNLKDARLYTQLSILGSVPLLENDLVVQRRKQMMWVGWATGCVVGLAVIAGSVAHYYLNKV